MSGIGKFVVLPKGTAVLNTLALTGTSVRAVVLEDDAIAIVDAADRTSVSFSVLLFRKGEEKRFGREEVAFHTLVNRPLSNFKTFATFRDAEKSI